MATQIFVNLPVEDLERSVRFFAALGFSFDAKYTDEKAACLILGENIYAMLLTLPFFATFTKKPVTDARGRTEVITAISVESRAKVDEVHAAAIANGGSETMGAQDYGFMYSQSFQDPDGHMWEVLYMDETKI